MAVLGNENSDEVEDKYIYIYIYIYKFISRLIADPAIQSLRHIRPCIDEKIAVESSSEHIWKTLSQAISL